MNARTTWILFLSAAVLGGYLYLSGSRSGHGSGVGGDGFVPVVGSEVTAVELARSNLVLRVERTASGWQMVLPVTYRAQSSSVDAFLEALEGMRPRTMIPLSRIADSGATNGLTAFGLDESALTLKLETIPGNPPVFFKLGGPAPFGNQFYCHQVGSDVLFTASDSLLASVPRTPDAWRDRSLFDLEGEAFDRVEVRGKPGFVAERSPAHDSWRLTRPLSARADSSRIETLLGSLQRLRVAGFVAESPLTDLGPLGLQPAEIELIVGRGSNDLVRLQFGRSPTNAPDYVFVRRLATTNLVLVPAEAAALLRLPVANFRDRRLLPPLDGVDALAAMTGTNQIILERRGTNWWLAGNPPQPADPDRVSQLLEQLSFIEIAEFPDDVPADLTRYGLAAPGREWSLRSGTNEVVRLAIGAEDGLDKAFVRRADEMPVYSVPLAEVLRLPNTAAQLRLLRFDPTNVVQVVVRQRGRSHAVTRGPDGAWQGVPAIPGILFDEAVNETLYRIGRMEGARYPVRDDRQLELLKFPEVNHELEIELGPGAPMRRLTLRFGGRNPLDNLFALAVCDSDEHGFLFEFPGALYLDVLRDFNVP
ncbi:MAG: DUF4340 domain-containing protein [Verrucomicrobiae bacterium]|nr:DUF4340 domain-containing protein [Verrucomicrobiae bacterium]